MKIFISSPGDVKDERVRAALVISRLKREFARFFDLSAVLWEYEPMLSSGHFQDVIDPPSTADIVVMILWSRLGTPLPTRTDTREYKARDGRTPVTGTEWEYEEALAAREARGGVPDLLVYRKFVEGFARFSRAEQLEEIGRQWESLREFWQRYFEEPDGRFKAAFNRFESLDEFETQLEQHLRELLRRRLPTQAARTARAQPGDRIDWWEGSPYRGLQAFDVKHAKIFFGRERAEREITETLVRRAVDGPAFMLVLGASGSGKSSLVRAGILPNLMARGVVDGVTTWRHAIVHPADLVPDPFAGLAAVLLRPDALPELTAVGFQEADVAAQLRADPALALAPLRIALERAATEGRAGPRSGTPQARLVLVLDQLEALFTSPAFSDAARLALDALFAKLAQSGLVWIVATLRSDFFHRLAELPELSALARGTGQYQLAQPNAAELDLIIGRPAEVAGLDFEVAEDTGISLAATIREAVARDQAALPLLSFVLDEIYRRDVETAGGRVLTYRTYRSLGGVGGIEGAIARHADQLVEGLAPELKSALPTLLLALVEIDELKGTATARVLRQATLADPHQRALADELVKARLAVADDLGGGETLRLAHEALLSHWPLLERLIDDHRDFLIVRRRLQSEAASWLAHDRHDDYLLPAGRRLAEAEEALADRRADLDPEIIAYAEASIAAERARLEAAQRAKEAALRRELTRSRRIAAMVSVLLLLAVAAGGYAWQQRGVATAALGEAERNYKLALDQAAGSVQLLTTSYDEGQIAAKLMTQLIEKAQQTANGLPGETAEVTAARAQLLDVLSIANTSLGIVAKAQQFAEEEVALVDGLTAREPGNVRWARLWAIARLRLSDALFWKGDSTSAIAQARLAETAALKLAEAHPDDDALQGDLINIYNRLGEALRPLGLLDDAVEAHRAWLKHAQGLVARYPDNVKWLASMGLAHQELGATYKQLGRAADSAVEYRAGAAIAAQLYAKEPENTAYLDQLTVSTEGVGDALLAQGAADAAMVEYRKALALSITLSNVDTNNFKWREILEAMHQRVGEVLLQQGDHDGALKHFQTYLALTKDMIEKTPTNGSAMYDVANAREKVGDALRAKGDLAGALVEYEESLRIATELNARKWWNGGWQKMLAMAHHRLGITLKQTGDRPRALAHFEQCAAVPVNKFAWAPRTLWPPDVVATCREEMAALGPAPKQPPK